MSTVFASNTSAAFFQTLSDTTRQIIVRALAEGEKYVLELCAITGKRQQAVTHHLAMMRLSGIVKTTRVAKRNYNRLTARGRLAADLLARLEDARERELGVVAEVETELELEAA